MSLLMTEAGFFIFNTITALHQNVYLDPVAFGAGRPVDWREPAGGLFTPNC